MKKILMAAAALTLLITIAIPITSCNKKDKMDIVIDLDSIVIKPYVNFGTKLAKVEKYMAENYADYSDENPNSLDYIELEGGALWGKYYKKGTHEISFYFINANGKDLTMVSYDFYSPIPFEAVMAKLERNGFKNMGEVDFDDNSDLSYLFLSPDESIEAMPFYWEKDGGSWALTFQPTNDFDLQHIVTK